MAKLILEHPHSGIIKPAPLGFSWTSLFFPTLPALFRGDLKGFILQVILACFMFPYLVIPFVYNRWYLKRRLANGFKVRSTEGITLESARAQLGINLPVMPGMDGE